MQIGFLSLLQFFLEPLQYFSIGRNGIIPGLYLGRIVSLVLIFALLFSKKHSSSFLVKAVRKTLLSFPYAPFSWVTIIAALPPLFFSDSAALTIRFGFIEPLTNISYIAILSILPSLISTYSQRVSASRFLLRFINGFLVIGFLDYFASFLGSPILGRSLFDRINVGVRFHSLFHEPRDYAVASLYFLAFLAASNLSSLSVLSLPRLGFKPIYFTIALLICSAFLTKSATFIIGLLLFLIVLSFYILFRFLNSFNRFPKSLFAIISILFLTLLLCAIGWNLILPARILKYFDALYLVLQLSRDEVISFLTLNPLLAPQASTFVPILRFFQYISIDSLPQLIFGFGHGSISAFLSTELYSDSSDIYNSYSGLPRLLYETGILGLASFSYMYYSIIVKSVSSKSHISPGRRGAILFYTLSSLALFCMYLIQRRQEIFLYMGIVNCYLNLSVVVQDRVSLPPS